MAGSLTSARLNFGFKESVSCRAEHAAGEKNVTSLTVGDQIRKKFLRTSKLIRYINLLRHACSVAIGKISGKVFVTNADPLTYNDENGEFTVG
jgi:hypothetical protein